LLARFTGNGIPEMRVLIAYDGSASADAALRDIHRAGLPRDAEALILTIAERWLPEPISNLRESISGAGTAPALEIDEDVREARQLALEAKSTIESYFTNWSVRVLVAAGSPATEILKAANDWMCNIIVVGCLGRSAADGFFLGSVSETVVHDARCSVRVCRGTAWKDGCPVRLLICVDGSPLSDRSVDEAARRVWPIGSQVRLLAVRDSPGLSQPRKSGENSMTDEWVRRIVNSAEQKLRSVGLEVSSRIEQGDPKRLIVAHAGEWGADCIMLGGASPSTRSPGLGEVATAVVARATCSVEVIRSNQMGDRESMNSTVGNSPL
jgi:nucleotide-binding universal stress UspA family protein